ncbi:MAG: AAA family ATPase, partial [Deltaproteobacteria bacterium]|nr:AAA family ATPase [Deltaproteobacteria bacterium]
MTNTVNTPSNNRSNRILALRGSRGGAGTSMIATNLGIFLAQIGKRVLLVDANLDNGDMHSWLGDLHPDHDISQVLHQDLPVEKAATATAITGLYLLAGPPGIRTPHPSPAQTACFIHQLEQVDADFVILDLPCNLDPFCLELFCRADYSALVTLPLPPSVENSYRFITAAWFHRLRSSDKIAAGDANFHIEEMLQHSHIPKTPREFTEVLRHLDDAAYGAAYDLCAVFRPQLIINQIKLREDADLGKAMVSAAARWLGINAMELGSIGWDDNAWLAQRRGRVLLTDFARSQVCKDLEQIVRKVMTLTHGDQAQRMAVPAPTAEQNYYELLEIYPGASEEEIRRAYKQIQNWFGL